MIEPIDKSVTVRRAPRDAFRLFTGLEPDADRMLGHFATLVAAPGPGVRVP